MYWILVEIQQKQMEQNDEKATKNSFSKREKYNLIELASVNLFRICNGIII